VEGQAQDLDGEVNGIAGQISFRPAPIGVLDDETGIGGQIRAKAIDWCIRYPTCGKGAPGKLKNG
jgi:hypothetical protein